MILLHCRTLYHDCDIYLLDDPFRWLGRQVSDRIFSRCILKLLKDKTIVLVTDKHRHIIKSDRIIALRNVSCGPIKIYFTKHYFIVKLHVLNVFHHCSLDTPCVWSYLNIVLDLYTSEYIHCLSCSDSVEIGHWPKTFSFKMSSKNALGPTMLKIETSWRL